MFDPSRHRHVGRVRPARVLELRGARLARHLHSRHRAAAVPVPYATTSTHQAAERAGHPARRDAHGLGRRAGLQSVGSRRTPPEAIVCATEAICSGVASTLPCPIAVEPTSSGVAISFAVRQRARGLARRGGRLRSSRSARRRPRSRATRASRRAARTPSCTSGRSCRGTCRRRTRRWRSRARRRRSRRLVSTGNGRGRLHEAALERGGGGHDLERRARAAAGRRTRCRRARGPRPCAGRAPRRRRAGRPAPSPRPPGGPCRSWCATRRARARLGARQHAPAGQQLAARAARAALLEARARARLPHRPVRREAARVEGEPLLGRSPAPSGPRSSRRARRAARCARSPAPGRAPCRRATRSVARLGGPAAPLERSPGPSPGKTRRGDQATCSSAHRDLRCAADSAEHARADHDRHGHGAAVAVPVGLRRTHLRERGRGGRCAGRRGGRRPGTSGRPERGSRAAACMAR